MAADRYRAVIMGDMTTGWHEKRLTISIYAYISVVRTYRYRPAAAAQECKLNRSPLGLLRRAALAVALAVVPMSFTPQAPPAPTPAALNIA